MATGAPTVRCGDVVRMRGERWRIVRQVTYGAAVIIDVAGCGSSNRGVRSRFLLPCEPIDRLPASTAPRRVTAARWRYLTRQALAQASPSWTSLRAAAHATFNVIPFQLEPALALVRGAACRFLLADAVGLGKTIQAGLMIAETLARRPDGRALVIAPAGLGEQWCGELRLRFGLEASVLDAGGLARLAAQLPMEVNPWAVQHVAVTSIDYVKRPETMRSLETLTWDVMVFDEAHNLTGRSDRAAAAALLADRARALVLLTATPHPGDDAAFARLCELGRAGSDEPLVVFRRTRGDAAVPGSRRAPLLRVQPTEAEATMHAALMRYARRVWSEAAGSARLVASVLARRACSSAASLARSIERRLALLDHGCATLDVQPPLPYADADDAEPEMVLGQPGLRSRVDERVHLELLLHLARAAAQAESKIAALRRFLSRTGEPVVLFTEYRDTLQRVAAALGHETIAELHGGQTPRERAEALRRFATGGARCLLATDAGSEGLNLHHRCRLVINVELPWTPLRLEQRAGRVDRIGQTQRVHIVHLVAGGTCEEVTLARLVQRLHRSRGTLSAFEPVPDERHVAEAVLADQPFAPQEGSAFPPSTCVIDLRLEAAAEAAWIRQARVLDAGSTASGVSDRPAFARVRSRSRRSAPARALWLFRLTFVAADGRLVWESLTPLAADMAGLRGRFGAAWRTLLDPDHPALQMLLRRTGTERLDRLQAAVHNALQRWRDREAIVISAMRARQARLSATFVQRGLFDSRSDRLASAQAALLDGALSQSQERLAHLAACEHLRLDDCDLVFAVLLE